MDYETYRKTPLVPLEVLTKLIQAGYGNRPQQSISRAQFNRAMAGRVDWRKRRETYLRACGREGMLVFETTRKIGGKHL